METKGTGQANMVAVDRNEEDGAEHGATTPSPSPAENENTRTSAPTTLKLEKTEYVYIGVMVLAVLAIVLALGLVFGLQKDDEVMATRAPTNSSGASSVAPSAAPSDALDLLLQSLPDSSLNQLEVFGSPQWNAYSWLESHPDLPNMPLWMQAQLFALTSFFYAFEGENWPEFVRNDWLTYDRHACVWFSSEFRDDSQMDTSGLEVCNEMGEYTAISLSGLMLESYPAFLPPEIALLSSLKAIQLSSNDIGGQLSNLIPDNVSELSMLEELNLRSNSLTGPIPTQVGLFPNLLRLDISENQLTGLVPSELGLLTGLEELNLGRNSLTGFIPSQVGMLFRNLIRLDLSENFLTGLIPSELGLLTALEALNLGGNPLSGEVPAEISSLQTQNNLKELNTSVSDLFD